MQKHIQTTLVLVSIFMVMTMLTYLLPDAAKLGIFTAVWGVAAIGIFVAILTGADEEVLPFVAGMLAVASSLPVEAFFGWKGFPAGEVLAIQSFYTMVLMSIFVCGLYTTMFKAMHGFDPTNRHACRIAARQERRRKRARVIC